MDVARDMSGANFNADDFARKRIDEMNGNAPEQVWVEEHHTQGMRATFIKPLDSVLKENNYFEYTRTDIAPKVKPLVWGNTKEPEYPFADTDFGRYEVDSLGVATFYHWHDRNLKFLCSEGTEQNAKAVAQAHHDALIRSALVTPAGEQT